MIFTQSEGTAARCRFPLYLVDATDGITPETGETGGQPQLSKAGGAWANTTATLTALGNGAYYVELTSTELNTLGPIQVRYKSANTAEFNAPGVVVAYNQHDAVRLGVTALPNAAAEAAGGLFTRGTGAGQINQAANGQVDANATHFAGTAYATAVTALVASIWNALTSGMSTAGSIGKKLADWTIHSAADVWAVATRVLTAATNITSTGGTTVPQTGDSFARLGAPAGASTAADIAAVKVDTGNLVTRITANLFAGITKMAEWLGLIAGKQTGDATARTEIRATGAGSGTFDETTDSQEALRDVTALDSTVAKAATVALDATVAKASAVSTLQTSVDDLPTNAELATSQASADDATLAAIAALNNLSAAQVNAEVVDALRTDTGTEVSSVPAAAAPIGAQIQYLYQGLRNKVDVTATAKEVHNDAGTVVGTKTLSDDGTTYSESKAV